MKTKLVLWGKNAQDERVLTAIELHPAENKVSTYIFSEAVATDDFAQKLMKEWRVGQEVELPEHAYSEKELSVTESMIPEGITMERDDLLKRAQTEWHFVVLSSKMHRMYQTELNELKERIGGLERFDSQLWDDLKAFWDKVQEQVKDRNLFREHADTLRDNTNALFERLKELRADLEREFQKRSGGNVEKFMENLADVEKRIDEGLRLSTIFDELKTLQRKFREAKFTREDRSKVWERLDNAFKAVKEKRFGKKAVENNSPTERLNRRQDGLVKAMERMERSIERDYEDLEFQKQKIARTDGQLEAQIRQAKIKMIEERINSKKERLEDMQKTMEKLDKQSEQQRERDEKRRQQEELEAARKAAKDKIAQEMQNAAAAREEEAERLQKAAEAIATESHDAKQTEPKQESNQEDSLFSAISTTLGETFEDVVDTVKAVAEVVSEKVGHAVGETVEDLKERFAEKEPAAEAEEPAAETTSSTETTEPESTEPESTASNGAEPTEEVETGNESEEEKEKEEK